MNDLIHTNSSIISEPCAGCGVLTLARILNCACVQERDNHMRLGLHEQAKNLNRSPWLGLNMTLVKQFADQCALCRMIHTEIRKATPSDSHVLSVFKVDDREGRIAGIWFYYGFERHSVAKLCCYADEGTYASRYLVHRHVSSSGSSTSISRIRKWLSDCEKNHEQCKLAISGKEIAFKPVLPTRVLSIRGYPESLHLFVTGGKREKYMALSHCWGGKPQYRTTKANLEENQRSIDSTRLSETIKNAIQIATSIDVPYLWVDSLCIIQEDEEDFIRESCMMASVYQQACCVIAATAAANGSMGLSQRTPSHSLTSLPCDPRKPEHGNMYLGPGDDQALERSLFRGPLNQRGWVLQERIFARRTIHFAGDQIYWECDKEFVGEDGGDMQGAADTETITRSLLCKIIDDFRGFRRNHNFPHQGRFDRNSDLHSLWAGLVSLYSRCGLSNPNDKLPALQSLTLELGSILNLQFHEGHLFDNTRFVLSGLLWRAAKGTSLVKPCQHRAPSWSWASTDGPINFTDLMLDDSNIAIRWYAEIHHPSPHDLEIIAVREYRPNGRQPGKALLCSGVALECFRFGDDIAEGKTSTSLEGLSLRFLQSVYTANGNVISADLEFETITDRPIQFHLIPLFERWKDRLAKTPVNYCLMVRETAQRRIFERIGVGWVDDPHWFCHVDKKFLVLI